MENVALRNVTSATLEVIQRNKQTTILKCGEFY